MTVSYHQETDCSEIFSNVIARKANLCFAEGSFPSQFQIAQMTSLIKNVELDTSDSASYKQISILNSMSKIWEKLILARLVPRVAPFFYPFQSTYY